MRIPRLRWSWVARLVVVGFLVGFNWLVVGDWRVGDVKGIVEGFVPSFLRGAPE